MTGPCSEHVNKVVPSCTQNKVPLHAAAVLPSVGYEMYSSETKLRVRYGETDQMGYVYYGVYAQYFEVGRVEALRALGFSYKRLEEEGVMLPVFDLSVKYHRPARYDDRITVRTTIVQLPSVRISFRYEVFDEAGVLLTEATTTLVFVERENMRPCRCPQHLLDAMTSYFP